jgi:hypothetical protein
VLFDLLARKGEVGSIELAKAFGVDRTPTIAFVVSGKRSAKRLGFAATLPGFAATPGGLAFSAQPGRFDVSGRT